MTVTDCVEMGIEQAAERALEVAWDGADAVWLSFDVDCLDAAFVPGTGWPEPGGFLPREVLKFIQIIADARPLAGIEVVECAAAVRQRRDHRAARHPGHLRHPRLPGPLRPPPEEKSMRKTILAAATAVVLVLAGCADGDRTRRAPRGKTTVRLGFSAWPGWFPWQVAQEQGLFAKNGVTVDLKYFESYTDSADRAQHRQPRRQQPDPQRHAVLGQRRREADGGADQRQLDRQRPDHRPARHHLGGRPQGQEGRRRAGHRRPLPAAARAAEGRADREGRRSSPRCSPTRRPPRSSPARSTRSASSRPFTTTALALKGSKADRHLERLPRRHPGPPRLRRRFRQGRTPTEVQAVVQTWFDTTAWIKANPDEAIAIMAKRGGVSAADYKATTPVRPSSRGSRTWTRSPRAAPPATSTTRPGRSATSWSRPAWPTRSRRWTGCSSPSSCRQSRNDQHRGRTPRRPVRSTGCRAAPVRQPRLWALRAPIPRPLARSR